MIYALVEIPYRYDPYDPDLNTVAVIWNSHSRYGSVMPRIVGDRVVLSRHLYKYKTLEIYSGLMIERVFVTEQPLLVPGQNIWQQPHVLHTLLLRQRKANDEQCVFRHIPSVRMLRSRMQATDNAYKTNGQHFLDHYMSIMPDDLRFNARDQCRIDNWTSEGSWPPETLWNEVRDVEPNCIARELRSHVVTPIVFDPVTMQTNANYPEFRPEHLLPLLHPTFGATGYHLTMTLDHSPLNRFDDSDAALRTEYYDAAAPLEFNQVLAILMLLPVRDIVVKVDTAKRYYTAQYVRNNRDEIHTDVKMYESTIVPTVYNWLAHSNFHATEVTLVKAWTEEVFIILANQFGQHRKFYVDLVVHGLCTQSLTALL